MPLNFSGATFLKFILYPDDLPDSNNLRCSLMLGLSSTVLHHCFPMLLLGLKMKLLPFQPLGLIEDVVYKSKGSFLVSFPEIPFFKSAAFSSILSNTNT